MVTVQQCDGISGSFDDSRVLFQLMHGLLALSDFFPEMCVGGGKCSGLAGHLVFEKQAEPCSEQKGGSQAAEQVEEVAGKAGWLL